MPQSIALKNFEELASNPYPGRGIVIGLSANGEKIQQVYWIMGRSNNSRNRIFVVCGEEMRTKAFDESKLEDPSLIIYWPMRRTGNLHIVTNGDQTDTIRDRMQAGERFEEALQTREFEPDAPNFTPRISGLVSLDSSVTYSLSILKATTPKGESCQRSFFLYEQLIAGEGHGITTYAGDGDPLPSFEGEPKWFPLGATAEETLQLYWNSLNAENRVALAVKEIDPQSGVSRIVTVNKHT